MLDNILKNQLKEMIHKHKETLLYGTEEEIFEVTDEISKELSKISVNYSKAEQHIIFNCVDKIIDEMCKNA